MHIDEIANESTIIKDDEGILADLQLMATGYTLRPLGLSVEILK